MGRSSIFKTAEIKEIKRQLRSGIKVREMAKRLAPKHNITESQMLTKLYYISAHTYMTKGRPKTTKPTTMPVTNTQIPLVAGSKKVEMYADHIRIYF